MDMTTLQAIILGIVEGLTEFLPVSSTGHMIITTAILGMTPTDFVKTFTVAIQLGAILAVVVLYWKRFFDFAKLTDAVNFYLKLVVAFLPAGIIGYLLSNKIDELLGSVTVVAVSLLVGGIILIWVDKLFAKTEKNPELPLTYPMAFIIGCFQVVSMIPGVSRSAATITGGLSQKLGRKQAAEFSFFLAVPTMVIATGYKLFKFHKTMGTMGISHHDYAMLGIASFVAFIVALIAVKTFISFLSNHGLKYFGYYRIVVGGILLILIALGVKISVV